ncbi:MAG: hypothetical protein DBX97_03050 [Collinsella tanakaei]|nr:MAG: hypothetical protein DBX97_03050 [Collinsella tanakaei]
MEPEKGITVSVPKSDYTIYELPVASLKPRLFECLFMDKDDLHLPFAKVKKGEYIKTQKASKIRGRISRTYHALFDYRYISLDTKNYKAVMKDLEYIYKKYKLHKNDATVALIAHPKLADDIRVNNIANLIDMVSRFPEKYRFTNCMDLYKYLQINEGVKK